MQSLPSLYTIDNQLNYEHIIINTLSAPE